jgi:hypothetical protein
MMYHGTPQMRHFHRIVTVNLLLTHVPTPSRDDILWSAFQRHFRQCLEVTAEKEERLLHETIFNRRSKSGEPLYGFAMDYYTAVLNYNQVSFADISTSNAAHWMIHGLNLNSYPLLELHLQLTRAKEQGVDTTKLMEMIAAFPNLTTLTALEKQLTQPHPHPQRTFVAQMHVDTEVKQETAAQTSGSESDGQTYSHDGQAVLK